MQSIGNAVTIRSHLESVVVLDSARADCSLNRHPHELRWDGRAWTHACVQYFFRHSLDIRIPNMTTANGTEQHPVLFISHLHRDDDIQIADAIRRFVTTRSAGRVNVFQSSAASAGPQIGAALNEELLTALKDAQVLVLIYTRANQDWSYCMWEVELPPIRTIRRSGSWCCSVQTTSPDRSLTKYAWM